MFRLLLEFLTAALTTFLILTFNLSSHPIALAVGAGVITFLIGCFELEAHTSATETVIAGLRGELHLGQVSSYILVQVLGGIVGYYLAESL